MGLFSSDGDIERRLARVERKLDRILDHLGLEFDNRQALEAEVKPEILRAIDDGNKIDAIKRYRQSTGASLAEAKRLIDEIAAQRGRP